MTSQYQRLTTYLADSGKSVVELTFREIEGILKRPLPPSAQTYQAWWSNSGHRHASVWRSAGYRVYKPDLRNGVIRFVKGQESPRLTASHDSVQAKAPPAVDSEFGAWRNPRSKWAIEDHLDALDTEFERYLDVCEKRRIFSGPSVYFYARTIELTRKARSLLELAQDRTFHQSVYATLTSWGMHRMGESVTAKLTDFDVFSGAVERLITSVSDLASLSITELSDDDCAAIAAKLGPVVELAGITASGAPLVANTKTLHFVLPDLIPPMDRTYTGRFFFGPNKGLLLPGPARKNFEYMFSALHRLGRRHAAILKSATAKSSYLCLGHAKGLDNAVIGYVLSHPRFFPKPGRKARPADE